MASDRNTIKPHGEAWCQPCQKLAHVSRKAARAAIKRYPSNARLRAYQCPHDGFYWHVGHLPQATVRGVATADEVYGRDG